MSALPANRPWVVTRSVAPLGLALFDALTARRITDGLVVAATSAFSQVPRVSALTASGCHAFTGLLPREVEAGTAGVPAGATAVVTVLDVRGRYLPATLVAPLGTGAVVVLEDLLGTIDSIPTRTPVPLHSAPTRELPAHVGAVRAHAVRDDGSPADHALVEVSRADTGDVLGTGFADAAGVVVVPVVYPSFELATLQDPFDAGSPPDDSDPFAQSWLVDVRVFHGPAAADPPLPRPAGPKQPPTLTSLLTGQVEVEPRHLVGGSQGPPRTSAPRLEFGADLVIQTANDPDSRLIVTAASP